MPLIVIYHRDKPVDQDFGGAKPINLPHFALGGRHDRNWPRTLSGATPITLLSYFSLLSRVEQRHYPTDRSQGGLTQTLRQLLREERAQSEVRPVREVRHLRCREGLRALVSNQSNRGSRVKGKLLLRQKVLRVALHHRCPRRRLGGSWAHLVLESHR